MVLTEVGCSYREVFLRTLADAGVRPPSISTFASVEAVEQCVMAGMGMALLPAMTVVPEVAAGRLGVVPWAGPEYRLVTRIVLRAYEEASYSSWLMWGLSACFPRVRGGLAARARRHGAAPRVRWRTVSPATRAPRVDRGVRTASMPTPTKDIPSLECHSRFWRPLSGNPIIDRWQRAVQGSRVRPLHGISGVPPPGRRPGRRRGSAAVARRRRSSLGRAIARTRS